MSTFTPPVDLTEVAPFAVDTRGPALRLARHFAPGPRGRTVYFLSNGTVTEVDPDSETVFWASSDGSPYVEQMWQGAPAVPYTVTAEQETALLLAGYEVV